MTNTESCGTCGCGLSESKIETKTIDVDLGMDFSVMIRRYLEKHTEVDEDDLIQQVVICPERITAHIEADGDEDA